MKERIERLKNLTYIPQNEIAWLIEQAELSVKQREIIEENKRQQDVTVHQFRQAQKDIQQLSGDRKRYKKALEKIITNLNFAIQVAQNELEGDVK
ncbi:hypothetical protein [Bacillus subtilis]|uniref:hypothetical protein n=1 Tax=Bacillus subtilis TaxID=1423 RepID=UPI00118FE869|nr:hypothetical protein [Bacillus subtilis]MBO3634418.1 hypothetical protein [Bacillus subtilis]MCY8983581.1 hypothetical protein [Bacillus subtilis]TVX87622.1 hypothetical protein FQP35_11690 [Bacillus subtilis]